MTEFHMRTKHHIHVPQFDEEHRQLFEIVNMLRKALIEPDGSHTPRQMFAMLENHTRIHFANEERVMQQYAYPGFYAHRHTHENLLKELGGMQSEFESRHTTAAKLFNTSIGIWLTGHITTEDAKLGRYINAFEDKRRTGSGAPASELIAPLAAGR